MAELLPTLHWVAGGFYPCAYSTNDVHGKVVSYILSFSTHNTNEAGNNHKKRHLNTTKNASQGRISGRLFLYTCKLTIKW